MLKPITKNEVNEFIVLDYYITLIQEGKINFLSNRPHYGVKVITSIKQLKASNDMHSRIQSAKELWKLLFEASMTFIDPDKTGYDELFAFFDKFVDFEELIFASDSFYRDHTLHVLWVYFLGEYLYYQDDFAVLTKNYKETYDTILDQLAVIEKMDRNKQFESVHKVKEGVMKTNENKSACRCLAALTHDLGYPVKKIGKVNKAIKEVLPFFGIHSFDEFEFRYNLEQKQFIEGFITFLGLKIEVNLKWDDPKAKEILNDVNGETLTVDDLRTKTFTDEELTILAEHLINEYIIQSSHKKVMEYAKNFEGFQHGIMSAYLLLRTLPAFSSIGWEYSGDAYKVKPHTVKIDDLFSKTSILAAITNHTNENYRITSIDDESSFLTFMDELEEFSRISRANQSCSYVEEFCRTKLFMNGDWFQIDFIFDNQGIEGLDPERAFKGRCKRFLRLFDVPNMSEDLKIKLNCIGELQYDQSTYSLEIARNHARITIDGEQKDIPKYLKSSEFYTTEEYNAIGQLHTNIHSQSAS